MHKETPYPTHVWEVRKRQLEHGNLSTLFEAMYTLCDRIIGTFFDDAEMVMPVVTLDHDGSVAGKFTAGSSLGLGPVINLNPWGNKDGIEMAETLAHEVLHLWEHTVGTLNDNNRHTDEFHQRMWALYGIRTTGTSGRHGGHDHRWDEFLQMQDDLHLDWFNLPGPKIRRRQFKHECMGCGRSFWSRTKMDGIRCAWEECPRYDRAVGHGPFFVIRDDGSDEADQV